MRLTWIGLAAVLSCALAGPARGQTWTGAAGNSAFTSNANWAGGVAPVNNGTADLIFGTGNQSTVAFVNTPYAINSLLFDQFAPGYSLSGNTLTLGAGGLTSFSAFQQTFSGPLAVVANQTWANNAGGTLSTSGAITLDASLLVSGPGQFNFSGVFGGAGGLTFQDGTRVLSGAAANTYTGTTTVNSGVLILQKAVGVAAVNGPLVIGSAAGGAARVNVLANEQVNDNSNVTLFDGGVLDVVGIQERVRTLTFNGGSVSAGGGLLRLSVPQVTSNASAATATIQGNFQLDTFTTFDVAAGNAPSGVDLNVIANLSGAAGGVIKNGAGTLRLAGANTYPGQNGINGGTVVVGSNTAFSTTQVNVNANATIRADGGPRSLANAVLLQTGATLTVDGPGDLLLSGPVGGNGALTKIGPGALTFQGSAVNSYLGTTTVNEGRLSLNRLAGVTAIRGPLVIGDGLGGPDADVVTVTASNNLLNAPVTVNNSGILQVTSESIPTLTLTGGHVVATSTLTLGGGVINTNADANPATVSAGLIFLNAAATVITVADGAAAVDLDVPGVVTTNAQVRKAGAGTLRLGAANTLSGTIFHDGGTIVVGNNAALGTAGLTVNGGALRAEGAPRSLSNPISLTGNLTVNGPETLALGGGISGGGGILKDGAGFLILGNNGPANTYTGATTVNGGTLVLQKLDGRALNGPLTIGDGVGGANADQVIATATFQFVDIPITVKESGWLQVQGVGHSASSLSMTGGHVSGYPDIPTAYLSLHGDVTTFGSAQPALIETTLGLAGGRTFSVANGAAGVDLDISAIVVEGGIVKTGPGTMRLSGANTFASGLTINNGAVILAHDAAAGTGQIALAGGGTFVIDAPRTLANAIDLGSGLTVNNAFDLTLDGPVSGAGAIVRGGGGSLRLTANNSFAGGLTLNAGTLFIGSDTAVGTGPLILNGGGIVVEGGSHALPNAVTLGVDVTLPGPNALSFAGPTTLAGGNRRLNVAANTTLGLLGGIRQDSAGRALTKVGAGTLVLGGASTFSGPFNVLAGTVESSGDISANIVNRGTFLYRGGTLGGGFVNQGTFELGADLTATGGFDNQTSLVVPAFLTFTANGAGLSNIGSIALDNGTLAGTSVLNDFGGTLTGRGNVNAAFTNNGALALTGLLNVTGPMSNFGTLSVATNQSLRPSGGLSNAGPITLAGGSIGGLATITNGPGGVIRGGGAVSAPLTNDGGLLHATAGSVLVLSNLAGGNVNGGVIQVDDAAQLNAVAPFASSGLVALKGPGALLSGGGITNGGSIVGSGRVTNPIANNGVLRAEAGTLTLSGAGATNAATGQVQVPAGGTVFYTQGLAVNAGGIALSGGTFDNSSRPLNNAAGGIIAGRGVLRAGSLNNNGLVSLADGPADVFGPVTNAATVNVTSSLTTFYSAFVNGPAGRVKNTSGTVRFLGSFTNQPGGQFISDPAVNQFLDLDNAGLIGGGVGDKFTVSGALVNSGTWSAAGSDLRADRVTNLGTFVQTGGTFTSAGPFDNTAGAATIGGRQAWSPGSVMNVGGGAVTLQSDAGAGGANLSVRGSAAGRVTFDAIQHLAALMVADDAAAQVSAGAGQVVLVTRELSIAGRSKLDLSKGALVVDYTGASPLAAIRQSIRDAYAGGAWTGNGLTSSAAAADRSRAVGYAEANQLLGPAGGAFLGEAADATTTLARYTLAGDANLDGRVNFGDLVRLAQNYNMTVSDKSDGWWALGDFNYDGRANFGDLVKLAQNYNAALPADAIPGASPEFAEDFAAALAAVPEPSAGLVAIAACALAHVRRRPRDR